MPAALPIPDGWGAGTHFTSVSYIRMDRAGDWFEVIAYAAPVRMVGIYYGKA